jgi:arsenate reductase
MEGQPAQSIQRRVIMKKLLFICIENAGRSQIAEAFARLHGKNAAEAFSAGSHPSRKINPKVIEVMREIGYDLSCHQSKSIAEIPNIEYDVVVTMGCGDTCPSVRARQRIDWEIPDPKNLSMDEVRNIRDLIEKKVKNLLESMLP